MNNKQKCCENIFSMFFSLIAVLGNEPGSELFKSRIELRFSWILIYIRKALAWILKQGLLMRLRFHHSVSLPVD